jgi:hypothetical protein
MIKAKKLEKPRNGELVVRKNEKTLEKKANNEKMLIIMRDYSFKVLIEGPISKFSMKTCTLKHTWGRMRLKNLVLLKSSIMHFNMKILNLQRNKHVNHHH